MTKRIDAHMHICQWVGKGEQDMFDALRQYQRENEIEAVDLMSCTNQGDLWDGYEADQNIISAIVKMEVPGTYIHGCMFIPKYDGDARIAPQFDFVEQLEELRAIGFDGIKFCEFKPDSYVLHHMDEREEAFEKYFDWCEREQFPMCWHIADPDEFWDWERVPEWAKKANWWYGDGGYPTWESLMEKTHGILERHPNMHVMLAHAFFHSKEPQKVVELFRKYPRLTLDLAPGWEMFEGFRAHYEEWSDIFRTYSDRILYATDATMSSGTEYCGMLAERVHRFLTTDEEFDVPGNNRAHGIKLEEKFAERILCSNAKRIVGEKPKELDRKLLGEYIKKYLPLLPDTRNRAMIEGYYRRNF